MKILVKELKSYEICSIKNVKLNKRAKKAMKMYVIFSLTNTL